MEYFKLLPVETTLDILSRVPTESVLECKSVCKSWNQLVSNNSSFSKMHLHYLNHPSDSSADSGKLGFLALTDLNDVKLHYFEYNENHELTTPIQRARRMKFTPPFKEYYLIIGSINGLICLVDEIFVCICNPINKEYVMLPEIKTDCWDYDPDCHNGTWGFGYVSSTNEYKIVQILPLDPMTLIEVHIYTLGSGNGWRNLGLFNNEFGDLLPYQLDEEGTFANGALHWISMTAGMILTFDLAEEKFCEPLSPPPLTPERNWDFNRIRVVDGLLFFAIFLEETCCYDLWLFKRTNDNHDMKEPKVRQSLVWSKEFRIDNSELLAITKCDGVLTYNNSSLNVYDTKASSSKRIMDFQERIQKVFPHKNTLVSLKELGEQDTKIMGLIEIEETESHDQPFNQL